MGSCGKRESWGRKDDGWDAGRALDSICEESYEAGHLVITFLQPWASDAGFVSCIQVAQLPLSLKDSNWHHICIAWTTRDGLWSAYQDGELRGSGENLAAWHPIKPHGILILGQEQVRIRKNASQVITPPTPGPSHSRAPPPMKKTVSTLSDPPI